MIKFSLSALELKRTALITQENFKKSNSEDAPEYFQVGAWHSQCMHTSHAIPWLPRPTGLAERPVVASVVVVRA